MQGNSRRIASAQHGIHDNLTAVVERHLSHPFLKPIAPHNRAAFDATVAAWKDAGSMPLILDAGCGVGLSTRHLAAHFTDHFVIGIDQSSDRLGRHTEWHRPLPGNFILARADLVDYWRLLQEAGIRPARHYLLYPNPWPKIGHLGRRWHGHPVFPSILALGGVLECRSNWRIYIEELSAAIHQSTGLAAPCEAYECTQPITPFERKYLVSGHSLWRCTADLSNVQLPR